MCTKCYIMGEQRASQLSLSRPWFESMAYVVPKGTTTFPLIINFTIWERQIFNINAWETTGNDSKLQTKQEI